MRTLALIVAVALLSSTALAQQPLAPGGGPGGIRQGNQGQGIGWGPPVRPGGPAGPSPGPVGPPPVGPPPSGGLPPLGPLPGISPPTSGGLTPVGLPPTAGLPLGGALPPVGSPPGAGPSPFPGPGPALGPGPAPSPSSIAGLAPDTATAPGPIAVPPMGGVGGGSSPAIGGSGTMSPAVRPWLGLVIGPVEPRPSSICVQCGMAAVAYDAGADRAVASRAARATSTANGAGSSTSPDSSRRSIRRS